MRSAMAGAVLRRCGLRPRVHMLGYGQRGNLRAARGRPRARPEQDRRARSVRRRVPARARPGLGSVRLPRLHRLRCRRHLRRRHDEDVRGAADVRVHDRLGMSFHVDLSVPLVRASPATGRKLRRRRVHEGLHPSEFGSRDRALRGPRRAAAPTVFALRRRTRRRSGRVRCRSGGVEGVAWGHWGRKIGRMSIRCRGHRVDVGPRRGRRDPMGHPSRIQQTPSSRGVITARCINAARLLGW
jgi:hypothetical protein